MSSEPASYEARLAADRRWALEDASEYLRGRGTVHEALRRITTRLTELGIPYAVVGGLALFQHGYRRFTEDIDLLVTEDGLRRAHAALRGRGYRPRHEGARALRDTLSGVAIEFLVAGQFPGDGRPQPVAFPDPAECSTVVDGVAYLNLDQLVELKLASGLSSAGRIRDLADALELIRTLDLPAAFADRLDPSVRDKFAELRAAAEEPEPGESGPP
ncbi:MAG: nucleotidyltransferase family protein [Armatimonadetes bacterium]|nr:nucleotidyltransferase family protein [Armatimonadota bacterium]